MKYYFFINPIAGKGKGNQALREEIIAAARKVRFDTVYFLCGNGEEAEEYDE